MIETEIVQHYKAKEGTEFTGVLPLSKDDFILLKHQSKKTVVSICGNSEKEIDLPDPKKSNELNFYTSFFKYKDGFGLADTFGKLIVCESLEKKLKSVQLKHPHPGAVQPPLPFLSNIAYREIDDSFVVGIEEAISTFFPAKYWTQIKLDPQNIPGFDFLKRKKTIKGLRVLDVNKYPETSRGFSQDEWLSIQTIGASESKTLIHTNGGAATRSKSGPDFEFSIISEFDDHFEFTKNHPVENGKVFFTSSKTHFIVLPQNNQKLVVYNKDDFQVNFEVSLTGKQNLGMAKPKDVHYINMYKDYLYIGGKSFLNICRLKK